MSNKSKLSCSKKKEKKKKKNPACHVILEIQHEKEEVF